MSEETRTLGKDISDGLERSLSDEWEKGTLILFDSSSEEGSSVILSRICYGLVDDGSTVTYVTARMTSDEYIDRMHSMSCPISDYMICDDKIEFFTCPDSGERIQTNTLLPELRMSKSKEAWRKDVIIIESFEEVVTSLDSGFSNMTAKDVRRETDRLIEFLESKLKEGKNIVIDVNSTRIPNHLYVKLREVTEYIYSISSSSLNEDRIYNVEVLNYSYSKRKVVSISDNKDGIEIVSETII